jgi:Pentapeptide repeats (9 copies)
MLTVKKTAGEIKSLLSKTLPFGELVDLQGSDIHEPLVFENQNICSFDFSRSVFHAPLTFKRCRLNGLSWFRKCRFASTVTFSDLSFSNDARFDDAVFEKTFSFNKADVQGASDFSGCRFKSLADFSNSLFSGNLSLESTHFDADASFVDVECLGGLWANKTIFRAQCHTRGMDVHGRLWLKLNASVKGGNTHPLTEINAYGYQWVS